MPASITSAGGSEAEAGIALLPNGLKQGGGVEVNWLAATPATHGCALLRRFIQDSSALTPADFRRFVAGLQPEAAQLTGHVGDAAALLAGDLRQAFVLALLD
jgi:hypothetical protein